MYEVTVGELEEQKCIAVPAAQKNPDQSVNDMTLEYLDASFYLVNRENLEESREGLASNNLVLERMTARFPKTDISTEMMQVNTLQTTKYGTTTIMNLG